MFKFLFTILLSIPIFTFCQEHHFVIVIPSYNNQKWVSKCLDSVANQKYTNWSLIYIDDCSSDQTANLVDAYIKNHNLESKCTLIRNKERKGALANLYYAIHSAQPKDIIVTVDGDDWLAGNNVLNKLAAAYNNPNVWMTYGNFKSDPEGWGSCCKKIPPKIYRNNDFRSYKWVASHLRTFYAKLFHLIKKEDLMSNGKFYAMTWDQAMMFPMLEMSSKGHYKFIKDVLYIYNVSNPIMDFRVNAGLQRNLEAKIRQKAKYQPLEKLFEENL